MAALAAAPFVLRNTTWAPLVEDRSLMIFPRAFLADYGEYWWAGIPYHYNAKEDRAYFVKCDVPLEVLRAWKKWKKKNLIR